MYDAVVLDRVRVFNLFAVYVYFFRNYDVSCICYLETCSTLNCCRKKIKTVMHVIHLHLALVVITFESRALTVILLAVKNTPTTSHKYYLLFGRKTNVKICLFDF